MAKQPDRRVGSLFWYLKAFAGTLKSGMWQPVPENNALAADLFDRDPGTWPAKKRFPWPSPAPVFTWKKVLVFPDAGWTSRNPGIVSDRFRKLIEREGKDVAEFFPVRLKGPSASRIKQRYWYVWWRRRWSCHPRKSASEIDVRLIPSEERIAVVDGNGWWSGGTVIVRDDLRREWEREGLLAVRFEPVAMKGTPTTMTRIKDPEAGEMVWRERRLIPQDRLFDVDAYFKRGGKANGPGMVPNSTPFLDYVSMHSFMGSLAYEPIERFLKEGGDPNVGLGSNVSPLVVCMNPKDVPVVRLLRKHGTNFNIQNSIGYTALMGAAVKGQVDVVRELIRSGADPAMKDFAGRTAADHVRDDAARKPSRLRRHVVKKLLSILETCKPARERRSSLRSKAGNRKK